MNERQENLLKIARSFIGTPYKYAAQPEDIPQFLDCSSFTQELYKKIGIEIPRSTLLQAAQAGQEIQLPITNYQLLLPGDLLFFRGHKGHYDDSLFPRKEIYIGHVAIYTRNNMAIHASSPKGVLEENLEEIIKEKGPIVIIKRML